jgi:hypothetical protein
MRNAPAFAGAFRFGFGDRRPPASPPGGATLGSGREPRKHLAAEEVYPRGLVSTDVV